MKSAVMGSLGCMKIHLPQLGLKQDHPELNHLSYSSATPSSSRKFTTVCGGLRGGPRKPLWKSRVLSTEAIQAVQSLKLTKSTPSKLEEVFDARLSRLLKADLLDALAELHRQNEVQLALKVSHLSLSLFFSILVLHLQNFFSLIWGS